MDLPRSIDWGQDQRTEFAYDADGSRVLKRDDRHTLVTIPGLLDRRNPAGNGGNEIHNIHHVMVEGRVVAQVNRIQADTGGEVTRTRLIYLNQDHQGSTILATNTRGVEPEQPEAWIQDLHYDPFGRRLNADYTPQEPHSHSSVARFGFTGHEHDDELGLINMKGRIYDPEARRFLSPDPAPGDPLASQSYNRYAYALNNPATLVDPSGYQACGIEFLFGCPALPTTEELGSTIESYLDAMAGFGDQILQLQMIYDEGGVPTGDDGGDVDHLVAQGEAILVTPNDLISHNGNHFYRGDNGEYIGWLASESEARQYATEANWLSAIENSREVGRYTDEQWEQAFGGVDNLGGALEFGVMLWATFSPQGQRAADLVDLIDSALDDGPVDPLSMTPPGPLGPRGGPLGGGAPRSGAVRYGELDDLNRPTGVTATLTKDMVGTGSPAARSITPPGFGGGEVGHARGHLLGNQLGGSGSDPRNLVTIFQNPANSPVMRGYENQIRAALESGQVVDYTVTPIYRGFELMPVGITLRASGSGGLDISLSVLNRGL
jgi:RHS repeat-associated protein